MLVRCYSYIYVVFCGCYSVFVGLGWLCVVYCWFVDVGCMGCCCVCGLSLLNACCWVCGLLLYGVNLPDGSICVYGFGY